MMLLHRGARESGLRPPRWLTLGARLLGGVYLAAGLAKLPVLGSFTGTVAGILSGLSRSAGRVALAAALAAIALEILCGAALVLHRRVRAASLLLALETAGFLLVLYPAAAGGSPLVCNCFGALGVRLSNQAEFALDLLLLDLLLATAALWPRLNRFRLPLPPARRRAALAAAAGLIAVEGVLLGGTLIRSTTPQAPPPGDLLPGLAGLGRAAHGQDTPRPERTMLFLLNFGDFTCPPCFADFLALADSLRQGAALRDDRAVLGLMRTGGAERLYPVERLRRWALESGLGFPVSFLSDSLFDATGARKSLAAVLDRDERVLFRAEFPMGSLQRTRALELLRR